MNIFFAGATGVIGRVLLPRLVEEGHVVTAITRSPDHVNAIRAAGANAVVCDVFDVKTLKKAVLAAKPEVVIHQLTAIPDRIDPKHILRDFADTNRLRVEGTRILMDAALAAGASTFLAQSVSMYYAQTSTRPATENESLYLNAPSAFVDVVRAVNKLEDTVTNTKGINGIVLRYGHFYGPGTAYAVDGTFYEDVKKRRVPIMGKGTGTFSFIHVEDAADATVRAIDHGQPGIFNIGDDDPAPIREWLPIYAQLADAPAPMKVPKFIGHFAAGRFGVYFMTEQRGASNNKARTTLDWKPRYSSWRDGFQTELKRNQVGV